MPLPIEVKLKTNNNTFDAVYGVLQRVYTSTILCFGL